MSAAQHGLKRCHGDMGCSWEGDVTCHLLILYFTVFRLHCNNFLAVILEGDAGSVSSVSQQGGGEQSFQALKRRIIQASGAGKFLSSSTWLKWEERNYFLASSFPLNIRLLCSIWGVSEEDTQWTGTGLDPAREKHNDRVKLLEKGWKKQLPITQISGALKLWICKAYNKVQGS